MADSLRWTLRPAKPGDADWIAELRAVVMRPDLERLGRFDPQRVRRRFLDGYRPGATQVVVVDGVDAGAIALRADTVDRWLEHFYLPTSLQGRGLGTAVLARVLADAGPGPIRLNVLQGSRARALYERHGFVFDHEDTVDVFLVRPSDHGDREPV